MKLQRGSVLVLASLASGALAQTRPLETEVATFAPAGRIVVEAGIATIAAEPSFLTVAERRRWDVPRINLVYSPSAGVEIDLEWTARVIAVDDPDFGTVSDWGDVVLRTKLRLAGERGARPALAARFFVTLPQTNQARGLGPNTLRAAAQLLMSKSFAGFAAHVNAGLAIHDEVAAPHSQNDLLAYGIALERSVGRRFALLGELAGRAGEGAPRIDRTHEVRFGARLQSTRLTWDAAVRRGVSRSDGRWGFTAGLAWQARASR